MSSEWKSGKRSARDRRARQRRRLIGVMSALVGSMLAATGGWLYAGARPTAPETPATSAAAPSRASMRPTLGPPELPDPVVRAGALQVPIVDWTEVLPSCH